MMVPYLQSSVLSMTNGSTIYELKIEDTAPLEADGTIRRT